MAMCAGVQKVSRPMVRCHEMSQRIPTAMNVPPASTMRADAETFGAVGAVRAAFGAAIESGTNVCELTLRIDNFRTRLSRVSIHFGQNYALRQAIFNMAD